MPSECNLFVGIDTNEGDSDFLDVYLEGSASTWVAVGFSTSNNMVSQIGGFPLAHVSAHTSPPVTPTYLSPIPATPTYHSHLPRPPIIPHLPRPPIPTCHVLAGPLPTHFIHHHTHTLSTYHTPPITPTYHTHTLSTYHTPPITPTPYPPITPTPYPPITPTLYQFDADVFGCNVNPNTNMVDALDTWNPQGRNNIADTVQNVGRVTGSFDGNRITCS